MIKVIFNQSKLFSYCGCAELRPKTGGGFGLPAENVVKNNKSQTLVLFHSFSWRYVTYGSDMGNHGHGAGVARYTRTELGSVGKKKERKQKFLSCL